MKNFLLLMVCIVFCLPAWALTAITTNRIKGGPFCGGSTVNVSFTIDAAANAGNIFTAQLSDKKGSFDSPVNIGTLASTEAGTIIATIPSGTVSGNKYQIRVISSNPSVTGSPSKNLIRINPPPKQLILSDVTACSAVLTWAPVTSADHYQVLYKRHGRRDYTGPFDVTDTTYSFTGLSPVKKYDFMVRSVCSGGDVSSWDSLTAKTDSCAIPGNLHASTIGVSTASLDWNDAPCATDYSLRYRLLGTETWTYKHPTVSNIDLTGLCPACDYQAQVATRCTDSDSSAYGNMAGWEQNYFRIAGGSDDLSLLVYPNPSNGTFQLQFSAPQNNLIKITVENVFGQVVYSSAYTAVGGLQEETIALNQQSPGVYLVRVSCGDQNYRTSIMVQ